MRQMRISPSKCQKGFTLNEVLIAIALIAIGVLGFSLNTVGVIQGNQVSGSITIATNLAQQKLEELKAQTSFTNVNNCSSPPDHLTAAGVSGGVYNRCWIITDRADLGTGLKEFGVTVSWTEYGMGRNVVLGTLVFTG